MKIYKKLAIISLIGSVLTIIGLITGILWSTIYSSIIHTVSIRIICYFFVILINIYILYIVLQQLSLTPTSTSYKLWEVTPIPMYLKLYMFNLTNYEDFISINGSKPNFVEMGPYVFRYQIYFIRFKLNIIEYFINIIN